MLVWPLIILPVPPYTERESTQLPDTSGGGLSYGKTKGSGVEIQRITDDLGP